MKRDWELIRRIVFAVERAATPIGSTDIQLPAYTAEQVAYHCELVRESGMLDPSEAGPRSMDGAFLIVRLTAKGHDFADAARSDSIWHSTMKVIDEKVGGVTFDVLMQCLQRRALVNLE